MPWNDNANPGPWGSPPSGDGGKDAPTPPPRRGTGGRGPGGGSGLPPDWNDGLNRLRGLFGGATGGTRPGAIGAMAAAAFGLWAASGIYIVQPNEQAVVMTFGRYSRSETPGLRYHLPSPMERVEKVAITTLNKTDVGGTESPEESLMLTGDVNIVDVNFSVTWRVADAARYVFAVRDQEGAVKDVAESAMREVVGKTELQSILSNGRGQVQLQAADLMQKILDRWGTGVTVVEVQIRTASPPNEVADAFRQVANAQQDAQSKVNEANTYRNRVINEAKGDAAKLTQAAEAYREQSVREAVGETARFNQIYGEYSRAPGVTRQRLYMETMQRILARSNKVVIDGKGASAPIILPPDVFRPKVRAQDVVAPTEAQAQAQSSIGAPR